MSIAPDPTCRWCDAELEDVDINEDGTGMTGHCPNPDCVLEWTAWHALKKANSVFVGACTAIVNDRVYDWKQKLERLSMERQLLAERLRRAAHEPAFAAYLVHGSDR